MARSRDEAYLEEKRQMIINATIGMITEEGYKSFSLNKLLAKLDMPKGNFFYYFKSKKQLMDKVFDFLSSRFVSSLQSVEVDPELNPKEKLVRLYHISSERTYYYGDQGEQSAQAIFSEKNRSFIEMVADSLEDEYIRIISSILKEGLELGVFRYSSFIGTLTQIIHITKGTNQKIGEYMLSEQTPKQWQDITEVIDVFGEVMGYMLDTTFDGPFYKIKGINI